MKKITALVMTAVMLITVISCGFAAVLGASAASYKTWTDMGADYTESVDAVENPDRGFYRTMYLFYNENTMKAQWPSYKFVHLRISLSSFSHNYLYKYGTAPDDYVEGGYIPLSDEFLNELKQQLSNFRWNGTTAVIRFAYDNFEGYGDCEPSMEGILYHISQLKSVLADYTDVLSSVESGFLGPWGEQHTSSMVNAENIKTLVDALLDAVPEPITVSVRRPLYYAYAAGIDVADLSTHRADKNSKYYRLGVFNDGYLGSETDRGTYKNREVEVNWLDYQASHTLFGGEVASDHSSDGNVYNTVEFMSGEMFKTHTSYLNKEWNDTVITEWQNTTYTGGDPLYNGLSGFTYIENHMGYRFVLKGAECSSDGVGTQIRFTVENVGAGNVLKDYNTSLIFVDSEGNKTYVDTSVDVKDWKSLTKNTETVDVTADLKSGEYKVYFRIADPKSSMMRIRFANSNEYSDDLGNYIGTCNVVADFENSVIEQAGESFENLGIGGGGAFYRVFIDPTNSEYYYATCDMGGLYWSHDAGRNWSRTETYGAYQVGTVADDGTFFSGYIGLWASYDHGQSVELIYPSADTIKSSINRRGGNAQFYLADDFNNGVLQCVDTYQDRVYFMTLDWEGELRILSCDFDGGNLETLYKYQSGYVNYTMSDVWIKACDEGVYYAEASGVKFLASGSSEPVEIYTAKGSINEFEKIGEYYFILDDSSNGTQLLYTTDFVSYGDLNEYNTLTNEFERYGKEFTFDWHFSTVKGNNFNNIFLGFYAPVSSEVDGIDTIYGVMKFDGEKFSWVLDSVFQDKSTVDYTGWSYGSIGPIMSIANAPLDDNLCLMTNWETVYSMYYDGNDETKHIRATHCNEYEDGTYSSTGLDVLTTYSVQYDPFNDEHIVICTTDIGLQISYNGGKTWTRVKNPGYESLYNTCYDLYFDENTEGLVYGLWSSRHDVPFKLSDSDKSSWPGAFGVSYDGGNTWDMHDYSTGLPETAIPCKMSVAPYGDELMIAVATFNDGFYLSYDSGKTFAPINDGVESYQGMIRGTDIEIAGDDIYMLTCHYQNGGNTVPAKLYRYSLSDGTTKQIDMGDDIVIARTITYDERKGLFINVIPDYEYQWFHDRNYGFFVNYGGGVYKLNADDTVSLYFSNYNGIFDSGFSPDGVLYAVEPYGNVYVETSEGFRTFADGLFTQAKNISFSPDGENVFITTFGGGTYKLKTLENIRTGKVNNSASLYSWDLFFMNDGDYSQTSEMLKELNITRVYQEFPEVYLTEPETPKMIANLDSDGIETVALAGDRSWGLAECDLSEIKAHIDALNAYNLSAGASEKITKIALDIETYTYSAWKASPQTYFTAFIDKMAEIYTYAHSKGFDVVQVIPTHFDNISVSEFRRFLTTCCDEISLMNYTKSTQISAISGEVELCRELNMPIETIFETMPLNEHFSVTEDVTYFYEGFDALAAKRDKILDTYLYENLSVSYHYHQTLYHVYTGNYFAEIYAYSADETDKDYISDLGQTTGLDYIVLTGDDGSVIKAYLYNPNKTATYPEWCYLAVGVKKGMTYTITSGDRRYTVTSGGKKTITLDGDDLIYYTSIGIDTLDFPEPQKYTVTVPSGCTVTQTLPDSSDYYLTTVQAPSYNENGDYFTYWVDGDGNVVGTYRTYSFYTVKDETFTPVYFPAKEYMQARSTALYSSRMLDCAANEDGTYSLLAEHSVSTTESITGHGILATTNSALAGEDSLLCGSDNDDINNFMARSTLSTRTGMLKIDVSSAAECVWARTYIIDGNGEYHYGKIVQYNLTDSVSLDGEEVIMLDSQSIDCSEINEDNEASAGEPTPEEQKSLIGILKEFISLIIELVNFIFSAVSFN